MVKRKPVEIESSFPTLEGIVLGLFDRPLNCVDQFNVASELTRGVEVTPLEFKAYERVATHIFKVMRAKGTLEGDEIGWQYLPGTRPH